MAKVLIVDDQDTIRHFLSKALEDEGHEVAQASSGEQAMEYLATEHPDAAILDLKLPGMSGMELLERIKQIDKQTPVIMITAYGEVSSAVKAIKTGAFDYIGKPVDIDRLLITLRRALDSQRIWLELAHLRRQRLLRFDFDFVVGGSAAMQTLMTMVENLAKSDTTTVLVEGESGTGKELVANMIHMLGPRKDEPLMEINCGSLPEELLESELFGHERGAFTDAKAQKRGLLELANGGTVFLDEVGEMSLTIQVKLLRVIERMTFKRVGGTQDIKVSLRIISATNKDLAQRVREGLFREDLYYRLKVVPIRVPPLRERREDIELLAKHFLNNFNKAFSKDFKGFSEKALKAMCNYAWPGNVRELKNVIERTVLLFEGEIVEAEHLSFGDLASGSGNQTIRALENALSNRIAENGIDFDGMICNIERELIDRALRQADYNQSEAARLLGIKRDKLRYKIKALELAVGAREGDAAS
ncbi:MAG: sigma-54 dependent transcriptional regulator [Candidatus Eisenbacteria bacterium]